MALALIENIQREDLNPVEEARAYRRLGERDDLPQSEIARLVGKSRSHVANMQRLLALPPAVLDHLQTGRLDMGHARALVGHPEAEALAERAVAEGLSVREVEKLVRRNGARRESNAMRANCATRPRMPISPRSKTISRSSSGSTSHCRRRGSAIGRSNYPLPYARPARPDLPAAYRGLDLEIAGAKAPIGPNP